MKRQDRKSRFAPKGGTTMPKTGTPLPAKGMVGAAAASKSSSKLAPDAVMSHMRIPPAQMPIFTRIIRAAMTIVLNDKTHHLLLQALQGPGPIAQKLAEGVNALLKIVFSQGRGALPPELLVPAGVYLVARIANFLNQSGLAQVADDDIGTATQTLIHLIWTATQRPAGAPAPAGAETPPQGPGPGAPPAAPPPAGGPGPGAPAAPPQGMIAGAQQAPAGAPPMGP